MEGIIGQHARTACALEGEERFKDELVAVARACGIRATALGAAVTVGAAVSVA